MSLFNPIQSLRNSILISKVIYFHIHLGHLISPCWVLRMITDHFPPVVGETLPSTCSRAAWPQTSETTRVQGRRHQDMYWGNSWAWDQSSFCHFTVDKWYRQKARKILRHLTLDFCESSCGFPWPVSWKTGITALPRRAMTALASDIVRLYLILC